MADESQSSQYLPPGKKSRWATTSITKTPIEFTDLIKGGISTTDTQLGSNLKKLFGPTLSKSFQQLLPSLFANIKINPSDPDIQNIPDTIHHEEAHQILLDPIHNGQINFDAIPSFTDMARTLMQAGRGGSPSQEAPAYAVERGGPIPSDLDSIFRPQFAQQLQKVDPQKAAIWQQLINNYSGSGIQ